VATSSDDSPRLERQQVLDKQRKWHLRQFRGQEAGLVLNAAFQAKPLEERGNFECALSFGHSLLSTPDDTIENLLGRQERLSAIGILLRREHSHARKPRGEVSDKAFVSIA